MPLSRQAPDIKIFRGGVEQFDMALLEVRRAIGGGVLNSAVFEMERVDLSTDRTLFQNVDLVDYAPNTEIEVHIVPIDPAAAPRVVHWGKLGASRLEYGPQGERVVATSRLEHHLIGTGVVDKLTIYDRLRTKPSNGLMTDWDTVKNVDGEHLFNPIYDGIVHPNKATFIPPGAGAFFAFIDLDTLHPAHVQTARSVDPLPFSFPARFWDLPSIVHYLMSTLNGTETYVKNPTFAELAAILPADPNIVRHLNIEKGLFLGEALDKVLPPYGFSWYVEFTEGQRKIKVFKRNDPADKVALKLQQHNDPLDWTASNVPQFDLSYDIIDRATNNFVGLGGYAEKEITVELRPAWEESFDFLSNEFFDKSKNEFEDDDARTIAWRKFVANEAGDYTGSRPWFTAALDMSEYLEDPELDDGATGFEHSIEHITRRRTFRPIIGHREDGTPKGNIQGGAYYLEWWDHEIGEWKPITGTAEDRQGLDNAQGAQVLQREMGIEFVASGIPWKLKENAGKFGMDSCKLRITATVRFDTRVRYETTPPGPPSLIHDQRTLLIDTGQRYQYRAQHTASKFFMWGHHGVVVDGPGKLGIFGDTMLERHNSAALEGSLTIEGIDWKLENALGKTLEGLQPRNVNFRTNQLGLPNKFPSIIGISWNIQEQRSFVHLESYRALNEVYL